MNIFTEQDMKEGADNRLGSALGPHYFSARRFTDDLLKSDDWDAMLDIAKKAAEEFAAKVQDALEYSIKDDAESNVQNHIWRTVDQIVRGILSGEKWVMDRYALGSKYDCEEARQAIAAHIPDEIAKARINDLEEQVAALKKDIEFYRNRY